MENEAKKMVDRFSNILNEGSKIDGIKASNGKAKSSWISSKLKYKVIFVIFYKVQRWKKSNRAKKENYSKLIEESKLKKSDTFSTT